MLLFLGHDLSGLEHLFVLFRLQKARIDVLFHQLVDVMLGVEENVAVRIFEDIFGYAGPYLFHNIYLTIALRCQIFSFDVYTYCCG